MAAPSRGWLVRCCFEAGIASRAEAGRRKAARRAAARAGEADAIIIHRTRVVAEWLGRRIAEETGLRCRLVDLREDGCWSGGDRLRPIVILDHRLLLDVLRRCPPAWLERSLVVGVPDEAAAEVLRTLLRGARCILRSASAESVIAVLQQMIHCDGTGALRGPRANGWESLTRREVEIVDVLCRAGTNAEIGRALGISENTVKIHVQSILRKLDLTSRNEILRLGIERSWP